MGEASPSRRVRLARRAERRLRRLDTSQQRRVLQALNELERDPLPSGKRVKRLQASRRALYRLRVGNLRIIYELTPDSVDVLGIVPRDELDRFLRSLE